MNQAASRSSVRVTSRHARSGSAPPADADLMLERIGRGLERAAVHEHEVRVGLAWGYTWVKTAATRRAWWSAQSGVGHTAASN